jgi:hypothetical protein
MKLPEFPPEEDESLEPPEHIGECGDEFGLAEVEGLQREVQLGGQRLREQERMVRGQRGQRTEERRVRRVGGVRATGNGLVWRRFLH